MGDLGGGKFGPIQQQQSSLLGNVGIGLQVGAALSSAIGAFYSVKAAQYQAESAASSLDFQRSLANINARNAERDAQHSLLAGQREAGRVGLRYRQIKASMKTVQAAAGIQAGVGSAGEVAASIELSSELDQLAITRNSVLQANASRTGRESILNRATMQGISARNMRASAGAMNPYVSGGISLIGGAGQVAGNWYQYNRTK